jgi:LL-diaminopimelate aminotransferase
MRQIYQRRRDLFVAGLREIGWEVEPNPATFYLWVKCPKGCDSRQVSRTFLEQAGVVITPGIGFGKYGEGYVRMTLTVSEQRLREVLDRIEGLDFSACET